MKIFEKLNISTDGPFICMLASAVGVGKTTLLTMIAADLTNQGKKVLYISEHNDSHILRKFKRLVNPNINKGSLRVMRYYHENTLNEKIRGHRFDYIFLDISDVTSQHFANEIKQISVSQEISVFITSQLGRRFIQSGEVADVTLIPNRVNFISDYIIVMTKENTKSLFNKIKSFFGLKVNNIKLDCIKNRRGNEKSIKLNIDFKQINEG